MDGARGRAPGAAPQERRTETAGGQVEEIDFRTPRGLDREVLLDLAGLEFVRAAGNVIITGPTGLGKTYLACALADRACRRGFTALYKRSGRLVFELALARADGSYLRMIEKLARIDLLILDDWGLGGPRRAGRQRRHGRRSTIAPGTARRSSPASCRSPNGTG